MITTTHHIRVAFTYPPDDDALRGWDSKINMAIFDLGRYVDDLGSGPIDYLEIDDVGDVTAQCERKILAFQFQELLWELLEAYGCEVDREEE